MSQQPQGETPTLIPRRLLFGNPDKASPQISPNGTYLSFLAPLDGVLNVWVSPADDPAAARPVTRDTGRGVRLYGWTYNGDQIAYLQDSDGDENWHIYTVDLNSDETRDLTPLDSVQAQIQRDSVKHPSHILVGLNDRDPQLHDLYLIDLNTGERELAQHNEGFAWFVADDDFNVRFAARLTADGGSEYLSKSDDGEWELGFFISMEDAVTTSPIDFDKTGQTLYLVDSRGRDTAALKSVNLTTGTETVLASNDKADVADTMLHPTEKTLQAVAFNYDRKTWQFFDDAVARDLDYLATVAEGDIEVVSRTLDDNCWIVAYLQDAGPVRYYRYLRESREARFLFTNRQALEDLPLVKVHPAVIPARDGLDLVCYYSLPCEADPEQAGGASEPLPLALLVHGGPWARDSWGVPSHLSAAGQPGLCRAQRQLSRLHRLWQEFPQRRQSRVGRQDARRPGGRGAVGHRSGHRRPGAGGHPGRQLRRLCDPGRRHHDPGHLCLWRGHCRAVQSGDADGDRAALLATHH